MMAGIQTKPEPCCPLCGARMTLRRPKSHQDWKAFWGCTLYPDCKGTRQIMANGKPESDDDDWDIEDCDDLRKQW